MSTEIMEAIVLGRRIGTASGWDQPLDFAVHFYDVTPAAGVNLPAGDVCFLFNEGLIETYDAEGDVLLSIDMLDFFQNIVVDRASPG